MGGLFFLAEAEGFEPPWAFTPKLFSRQPRYDRFDMPPYICLSKNAQHLLFIFSAPPRYALLRCPKFFVRARLTKFRPLPLLLLASSATGSARKRPHFDAFSQRHGVARAAPLPITRNYCTTPSALCQGLRGVSFIFPVLLILPSSERYAPYASPRAKRPSECRRPQAAGLPYSRRGDIRYTPPRADPRRSGD